MATTHIYVAKSVLGSAAEWRRRLVNKYPDDNRNRHAALLLDRLAAEHTDTVPAAISNQLDAFGSKHFSTIAIAIARAIGFTLHPVSLLGFVEEVLDRLLECQAEIDAAFPSIAKQEGA
jgi:hypothetical protein